MNVTDEEVRVCRHGNHPIDPQGRWIEFFSVGSAGEKTDVSFACAAHDVARRVEEYDASGVLTSALMSEALFCWHEAKSARHGRSRKPQWFDRFVADLSRVDAAAKRWEHAVWFGGDAPDTDPAVSETDRWGFRVYREGVKPPAGSLQAFVRAAEWKGYQASVDGVTYLSYTMCGRSIFQVEAADDFVSVILDEESPTPRGGIRSLRATADRAVALLDQAVLDWQAGLVLVRDDGVGFGI